MFCKLGLCVAPNIVDAIILAKPPDNSAAPYAIEAVLWELRERIDPVDGGPVRLIKAVENFSGARRHRDRPWREDGGVAKKAGRGRGADRRRGGRNDSGSEGNLLDDHDVDELDVDGGVRRRHGGGRMKQRGDRGGAGDRDRARRGAGGMGRGRPRRDGGAVSDPYDDITSEEDDVDESIEDRRGGRGIGRGRKDIGRGHRQDVSDVRGSAAARRRAAALGRRGSGAAVKPSARKAKGRSREALAAEVTEDMLVEKEREISQLRSTVKKLKRKVEALEDLVVIREEEIARLRGR